MPIKIRCACGNLLMAPEERVGQTGNCPSCNRAIKVELPFFTEVKKEGQEKSAPRRRSLLTRLFSGFVYLFFFVLSSFMVTLHCFSAEEIASFEPGPSWAKKIKGDYLETLLMVRSDQQRLFRELRSYGMKKWQEMTQDREKTETQPQKGQERKLSPIDHLLNKGTQPPEKKENPSEEPPPDEILAPGKKEPIKEESSEKKDPPKEESAGEKTEKSDSPQEKPASENTN